MFLSMFLNILKDSNDLKGRRDRMVVGTGLPTT
jgi:hypothetical protein